MHYFLDLDSVPVQVQRQGWATVPVAQLGAPGIILASQC